MPISFALMTVCTALVYAVPTASEIAGVEASTGSALMLIPGFALIGIFIYYSENTIFAR